MGVHTYTYIMRIHFTCSHTDIFIVRGDLSGVYSTNWLENMFVLVY